MTTISLRRGTAAQWTAANPTLYAGEAGLETDTGQMKFGNGANTWVTLPYFIPNHVHDAAAITTGTLAPARLPLANATQQGAVTAAQYSYLSMDRVGNIMSYLNSWTSFNATGFARLKATQLTEDTVSIAGMPKPGVLTDGTAIAQVPAGYIPNRDAYASCTVRNSSGTINSAGMAVVRGSVQTPSQAGQLQIFGLTSTTTYLAIGFVYNLDGS